MELNVGGATVNGIVREHHLAIVIGCACFKSSGRFLRGVRLILPDQSGVLISMDALRA
jgi:hypothetical protein